MGHRDGFNYIIHPLKMDYVLRNVSLDKLHNGANITGCVYETRTAMASLVGMIPRDCHHAHDHIHDVSLVGPSHGT